MTNKETHDLEISAMSPSRCRSCGASGAELNWVPCPHQDKGNDLADERSDGSPSPSNPQEQEETPNTVRDEEIRTIDDCWLVQEFVKRYSAEETTEAIEQLAKALIAAKHPAIHQSNKRVALEARLDEAKHLSEATAKRFDWLCERVRNEPNFGNSSKGKKDNFLDGAESMVILPSIRIAELEADLTKGEQL